MFFIREKVFNILTSGIRLMSIFWLVWVARPRSNPSNISSVSIMRGLKKCSANCNVLFCCRKLSGRLKQEDHVYLCSANHRRIYYISDVSTLTSAFPASANSGNAVLRWRLHYWPPARHQNYSYDCNYFLQWDRQLECTFCPTRWATTPCTWYVESLRLRCAWLPDIKSRQTNPDSTWQVRRRRDCVHGAKPCESQLTEDERSHDRHLIDAYLLEYYKTLCDKYINA